MATAEERAADEAAFARQQDEDAFRHATPRGPQRALGGQQYLEDVGRSAASGAVQGVASIPGTPGDIANLGAGALDYAIRFLGYKPPSETLTPEQRASLSFVNQVPTTRDVEQTMAPHLPEFAQPDYQPKTGVGSFLQYGGRFLPTAFLGPQGAARVATRTALPAGGAVAGEAAEREVLGGQTGIGGATGALAGGVAGTVLTGRPSIDAAIRSRLPPNLTQAEVNQARVLMQDAQARGITLTWPEALSQVRTAAGAGPAGLDLQRLVESAPRTRSYMQDFFAGRPRQISEAIEREAPTLGPRSGMPSMLGPQAAETAGEVTSGVREGINRAATPYYTAAEQVLLGPQEMNAVRQLPGFAEAAQRVRADPLLNAYVQHLPDNSVGFLNEVKKLLDQQASNIRSPMAATQQNLQAAATAARSAGGVRQAGIAASPEYGRALQIESNLRNDILEPLLAGPLGRIANAPDTKAAITALFPRNPLPGSEREVSIAVRGLAGQRPRVAEQLVRTHAEMVFNDAARSLGAEGTQFTGAQFARTIAGNPQQRANLRAAVEALPNGQARWAGFERFLEVVEATGHRMRPGSLTSFNTQELRELAGSGALGEITKTGLSPGKWFSTVSDRWSQWQLGQNLDQIARIITDPANAREFARIAALPPMSRDAFVTALRLTLQTHEGARRQQSPRQEAGEQTNEAGR